MQQHAANKSGSQKRKTIVIFPNLCRQSREKIEMTSKKKVACLSLPISHEGNYCLHLPACAYITCIIYQAVSHTSARISADHRGSARISAAGQRGSVGSARISADQRGSARISADQRGSARISADQRGSARISRISADQRGSARISPDKRPSALRSLWKLRGHEI